MSEDGRTDFNLSITIPNTKSRSNLKYNANYVKLSEYMNVDERLEIALRNQTKIEEDHNEIIIQIKGSIRQAIDTSRFVDALLQLQQETESKWDGYFVWYHDYEEISFDSANNFEGENKLWRRLDY